MFSQRCGPESGILTGSSTVHQARYQGTEPRPRGEACRDDGLHAAMTFLSLRTSWAGCQTNIPCSSHKIRTTGSSMLLKTLLESANQRADAQPRVFATERFQRLKTSRYHIVLDLVKVKPLFLIFFCGAIFKFGSASLSPHGHTGTCLTHNMPPSAPTKQRWLRTSAPRVFEDTSTGKWCDRHELSG